MPSRYSISILSARSGIAYQASLTGPVVQTTVSSRHRMQTNAWLPKEGRSRPDILEIAPKPVKIYTALFGLGLKL